MVERCNKRETKSPVNLKVSSVTSTLMRSLRQIISLSTRGAKALVALSRSNELVMLPSLGSSAHASSLGALKVTRDAVRQRWPCTGRKPILGKPNDYIPSLIGEYRGAVCFLGLPLRHHSRRFDIRLNKGTWLVLVLQILTT